MPPPRPSGSRRSFWAPNRRNGSACRSTPTRNVWVANTRSSAFATVAEVKLDNLDHAEALIGKALVEAAPPAGDDFPKIYPQIALGQLRLAQGANDLAMAAAKQAMSHTEPSDSVSLWMMYSFTNVPSLLKTCTRSFGRSQT